MLVDLKALEQRLAALPDDHPAGAEDCTHAAVAMILEAQPPETRVWLMRRSEHQEDPWSGHISLPGGRAAPGDADLLETAVRETLEEIGIDLRRCARCLGSLPPLRAVAYGRLVPLVITPYVFAVETPIAPRPSAEAQEVFPLPLEAVASGALDHVHHWRGDGAEGNLPSWRHDGRVVWGLTYRMLRSLLDVLRPPAT
ncbi:MAG TPA: CoA pyrophosphatase [Planctomycetota bacterium]